MHSITACNSSPLGGAGIARPCLSSSSVRRRGRIGPIIVMIQMSIALDIRSLCRSRRGDGNDEEKNHFLCDHFLPICPLKILAGIKCVYMYTGQLCCN